MFGTTDRQNEALAFLRTFRMRHGVYPSHAEIAAGLDLKSKSSVTKLLDGLEQRGQIRRLHRMPRAIEVIDHNTPDIVFSNLALPVATQAKLDAFCAAHGEKPADVINDAVIFHLDQMEVILKQEASAP